MFQLPIPLYDPDATSHRALAELAERAEQVAAAVDLLLTARLGEDDRVNVA